MNLIEKAFASKLSRNLYLTKKPQLKALEVFNFKKLLTFYRILFYLRTEKEMSQRGYVKW